jgi:predicted RNA binding protein YcfA (HicA-like mRNA interferase family)
MNRRLTSLKAKVVIRALERAGFVASRTSGSHCRLIHSSNPVRIHSSNPVRKVTVPLRSSTDLKRGTLRNIISQPA